VSDKLEVKILSTIALMEKIRLTSYNLENGERYDVGHNGGQLGNNLWAFD